jgi:curved DNA-binding protein CbpA
MPEQDKKLDPYKVLGLGRNATDEEIRRAYRKASRAHHPDRNPGDEEAAAKFLDDNWAFNLLSNPERRKHYDETGEAPDDRDTVLNAEVMGVMSSLLQQLFNEFMGSGDAPERLDLIEILNRRGVHIPRQRMREALLQAERELNMYERCLKRFKRKRKKASEERTDDNILNDMVRQFRDNAADKIKYIKEETFLKDFIFDREVQKSQTGPFSGWSIKIGGNPPLQVTGDIDFRLLDGPPKPKKKDDDKGGKKP